MPDDIPRPRVGIVMGSDSDWPVMSAAGLALREFGVAFEADVVSAHRMADAMIDYGRTAHRRGSGSDHRGSGWRGAPTGHAGSCHAAAGDRGAGTAEVSRRHGFPAVDRADAGRRFRWQLSPSATPATPGSWRYASSRRAIPTCVSR